MDIIRILTFAQLKASLENLKLKQKFFIALFLLAIFLNLIPHKASAFVLPLPTNPGVGVVFNISDESYWNYLAALNYSVGITSKTERARQVALRQGKLAVKIEEYLRARNSPLAAYSHTLVSVKNWKKIVSLANAESSLCRNYPEPTANCWGVGGSDLWDFGVTLNDGIIGMNNFLNQYPKRSPMKYSEMTFKQMNGLYKQPAASHWVFNAQKIWDDLSIIEKTI